MCRESHDDPDPVGSLRKNKAISNVQQAETWSILGGVPVAASEIRSFTCFEVVSNGVWTSSALACRALLAYIHNGSGLR